MSVEDRFDEPTSGEIDDMVAGGSPVEPEEEPREGDARDGEIFSEEHGWMSASDYWVMQAQKEALEAEEESLSAQLERAIEEGEVEEEPEELPPEYVTPEELAEGAISPEDVEGIVKPVEEIREVAPIGEEAFMETPTAEIPREKTPEELEKEARDKIIEEAAREIGVTAEAMKRQTKEQEEEEKIKKKAREDYLKELEKSPDAKVRAWAKTQRQREKVGERAELERAKEEISLMEGRIESERRAARFGEMTPNELYEEYARFSAKIGDQVANLSKKDPPSATYLVREMKKIDRDIAAEKLQPKHLLALNRVASEGSTRVTKARGKEVAKFGERIAKGIGRTVAEVARSEKPMEFTARAARGARETLIQPEGKGARRILGEKAIRSPLAPVTEEQRTEQMGRAPIDVRAMKAEVAKMRGADVTGRVPTTTVPTGMRTTVPGISEDTGWRRDVGGLGTGESARYPLMGGMKTYQKDLSEVGIEELTGIPKVKPVDERPLRQARFGLRPMAITEFATPTPALSQVGR